MIKNLLILSLLFCLQVNSQETQILHIDRFDDDKNNWGLTASKKWECTIDSGKLIILNKNDDNWCYFDSENLINLENKAYTEITFDFQIENVLTELGGAGFVFINDKNSKAFERVRLLIRKDITFFDKESWSYPEGSFALDSKFSTPKLEEINTVKIVLNNSKNVEKGKELILFLNNEKVFQSSWPISNFNKVGFLVQGLNKVYYDNLVIKQSEEINFIEDAFDYIFIENKKLLDHNGIEVEELISYIPIELVDNQNILNTKELIKSLRKNNKCTSIETKKVDFNGTQKEMFSFNYGNAVIEFFTDSEKPNPINVNFLDIADLKEFFKIYSNYNSYRYSDENNSNWPSNSWFSIYSLEDSYRAAIWRGM